MKHTTFKSHPPKPSLHLRKQAVLYQRRRHSLSVAGRYGLDHASKNEMGRCGILHADKKEPGLYGSADRGT